MIRFFSIPVAFGLLILPSAAPPEDFQYWSASKLDSIVQSLGPKTGESKSASENLGDFGNHRVLMLHREGDGLSELHETETDFYVVQSGEATLVVGGEIVDGKSTGPGEIRGASIRNGRRVELRPGDVVNIPSGTPHQVLVSSGNSISYMIVKVRD